MELLVVLKTPYQSQFNPFGFFMCVSQMEMTWGFFFSQLGHTQRQISHREHSQWFLQLTYRGVFMSVVRFINDFPSCRTHLLYHVDLDRTGNIISGPAPFLHILKTISIKQIPARFDSAHLNYCPVYNIN